MTRDDWKELLISLPAAGICLLGLGAILAAILVTVPQP